VTALAGYFDTFFDLPERNVFFSTGPHVTPTHWKQTVFYLSEPLEAKQGTVLTGWIDVRRPKRRPRNLKIIVHLEGKEQLYTIE
jgi:protein arginine N-methyltransferase 3